MPEEDRKDVRPRMRAAAMELRGQRVEICDVVCRDSQGYMEIRTAGALSHIRFAKICYSVRDPGTMIFV
jgi:hypothetical protein